MESGTPNEEESYYCLSSDDWSELKTILVITGPIYLGYLLVFCITTVTLTFVGHFDPSQLGAVGLAQMFVVCTGWR